jgi:acetyltransferase-like isoleucine patch superfamily enzyme
VELRDRLRRAPWHLRYRVGAKAASDLRRLAITATHRHCRVEFQGPVRIGPGFALDIPDRGELIVGPGVDFRRGFVCEISGQGRVTIGAGSIFTSHALVQCSTTIDIGRRAVFGQSLLIVDGNHRYKDPDVPMLDQGYDYRPITIGDGALITTKCTVLANIGERAVIGANSVVSKDIPPFCLAVGAPARVVEYFGPPERRPGGLALDA